MHDLKELRKNLSEFQKKFKARNIIFDKESFTKLDEENRSLIMRLIFAFGISFQLPVLLSLLARVGFIDSEYLKKRRKYVVVIIFAVAAVLTPPDPITQIGLGIPLLILYELSILSVKFIEKKKKDA